MAARRRGAEEQAAAASADPAAPPLVSDSVATLVGHRSMSRSGATAKMTKTT